MYLKYVLQKTPQILYMCIDISMDTDIELYKYIGIC